MTRDTAADADTVTRPAEAAAAVTCTGLAYAFGDTNAVDGLDLVVREGEVFGLLGPTASRSSGSGTPASSTNSSSPRPRGRR